MQSRAWLAGLLLLALSLARPSWAQTPEEIVRWIYLSHAQPSGSGTQGFWRLAASTDRERFFSRRMVALLAANDRSGGTCLDFGPEIPGNDFDSGEVARTLDVQTREGTAGRRLVAARFLSFGRQYQVIYEFLPENGFWRIDDIAGPGYRLSRIPCAAPEAPPPHPAPADRLSPRCHVTAESTLRLIPSGGGTAQFSVVSWQGGGHLCAADGPVREIAGGWLYEMTSYGQSCRMVIRLMPDGGLRLSDPDHDCKMINCGMRAAFDGLDFPPASRVDCATLPRQ